MKNEDTLVFFIALLASINLLILLYTSSSGLFFFVFLLGVPLFAVSEFLFEEEGCVICDSCNVGDGEGCIYMGVDGGDSKSMSMSIVDNDGDEFIIDNREGIDWVCGVENTEAEVVGDCKDVVGRSSICSGDSISS